MIKRGRITLEQAKAAIEIYEQISINLIDVDLKQTTQSLCLRRLYDCLRPKSKLPVINARTAVWLTQQKRLAWKFGR